MATSVKHDSRTPIARECLYHGIILGPIIKKRDILNNSHWKLGPGNFQDSYATFGNLLPTIFD